MPCRNDYEDQPSAAERAFPGAMALLCDIANANDNFHDALLTFQRLHRAVDEARAEYDTAGAELRRIRDRAKGRNLELASTHPAYRAVDRAAAAMRKAEALEIDFLVVYGRKAC